MTASQDSVMTSVRRTGDGEQADFMSSLLSFNAPEYTARATSDLKAEIPTPHAEPCRACGHHWSTWSSLVLTGQRVN